MLAFKALWPYLDTDLWWHLRVGAWVVEHRQVPTADPFSRLGQETGKPWLAYSWLFEVLIYGIYHWAGLAGVALYRVAMAAAILASLLHLQARRGSHSLLANGVLVLAAVTLPPILTERPWQFTILFSIWTLQAVLALRAGTATRAVWLLPVVYVAWANLHIQFVYGLFLLGLGCAAPVCDRLLGHDRELAHASKFGSPAWWRLAALTAACLAATLLNPYHLRLYGVVWEYATQLAPFSYVDELTAPNFRSPSHWGSLALFGAAAFALGCRQRLSSFEVLLLAASALLTFRAKREAWFMAATAVAILAASFPAPAVPEARPSRGSVALLCTVLIAILFGGWWYLTAGGKLQEEERKRFPAEAVAFIKGKGYPGPIYNDFNWGGYLIWNLPELPVSIDGRTNLYGDERVERAVMTTSGLPGWQNDPDLTAARVVLISREEALAELLRLDPRFRRVYEDSIAVVFESTL
jgi:hypothetical protein